MMMKYDLEFLKEKLEGDFQEQHDENVDYVIKMVSGFILVYVEAENNKEELYEKIKIIKEKINPGFIWGYVKETDSIYVTKSYGENRLFIFNPEYANRSDYLKGKQQILNRLDDENFDELFDQKQVLDKFYKNLWDVRKDLAIEIRDKNDIPDNNALMEAQNIIDRIIFTYFICDKGIITVGNEPITGNVMFSELINNSNSPWKLMKSLFFEFFAEKHSNSLIVENVEIQIPYLNGGLFRPKKIVNLVESDLNIEFEWKKLFNLLNKYTWIVGEKLPKIKENYEGNLTPEVLGHIYEKFVLSIDELDDLNLDSLTITRTGELKKGRKKIGAYYTPEKITSYISRNAIYSYLFGKNTIPSNNFPDLKTLGINETKKTLDKIENLTICDPSCGSGAFILKAGEELLNIRKILYNLLDKEFNEYEVKKDIIINNLFGIDIKEGAIEICKLRLWLWLTTSSYEKIDTLPNIEYNFIAGDSLVGWVNEEIPQSFFPQFGDKIFWTLDALESNEEIKKPINNVLKLLQSNEISKMSKATSILKSIYANSFGSNALSLKKSIDRINSVLANEISIAYLLEYDSENSKFIPFHWKAEFHDIITNGGFDIIIGNPPYGALKMDDKFVNNAFDSKKNDIAALFVERSVNLLKENGYLGYIITNAITFNKKFSKVREIISENFKECHISSFDRDKCRFFEGMTLSVSILTCFDKKNISCDFFTTKMYRETPDFSNLTFIKSNDFNMNNDIIGADFTSNHRLAKIGGEISLNILKKLISANENVSMIMSENNKENKLYYRSSGNYWYNMWNKKPYSNSKIKEIFFSEKYKDLMINIVNSSIFYFWMRVYGNGRDLNLDILKLFPIVNPSKYNILLGICKNNLMKYLFESFDSERNRFQTSKVKPILDISDILLGKLYGLSDNEIRYILNFETCIRGGQKVPELFFPLFDILLYACENKYKKEFNFFIKALKQLSDEVYLSNINGEKRHALCQFEDFFKINSFEQIDEVVLQECYSKLDNIQ